MLDGTLEIARAELVAALRTLGKLAKTRQARKSKAILSWAPPALVIELAGYSVKVPAKGHLAGQIRVDATPLLALAIVPPPADPVVLVTEPPDRLAIGTLKLKAGWQSVEANLIKLPANPTLPLLLALSERYTEAEIERSGCTRIVKEARERRDRVLDQATETLAPFGITRADLAALVNAAMKRKGLPLA